MSTITETTFKFEIHCSNLLEGLRQVSGVIENAQVMQILSCVKMTLSHGQVSLMSSDSDIQISADIEDELLKVDTTMSFAVPGKKLFEICRSLNADDVISFKLEGQWLHLSTQHTKFKLVTMPADDFPVQEFSPSYVLNITSEVFLDAMTKTSFAMALHDVRQFLNGLLLDVNPSSVRCVATDGHRLASYELADTQSNITGRFIIPRKAIIELSKLMKYASAQVTIDLSEKMLRVQSGRFSLSTTLIQGKYPDYERLMPKDALSTAIVPVLSLKNALQRAAILSQERFKAVRLAFNERSLNLSAENAHHEQIHESIDMMETAPSGEIAFNLNYLLDVLNTVDSLSISMGYGTAKQAVVLKPTDQDNIVFIIMPLTL